MYKSRKKWPRTIGEAVDKLLKLMSEDDKKSLKNSPENDLLMFHFNLGIFTEEIKISQIV